MSSFFVRGGTMAKSMGKKKKRWRRKEDAKKRQRKKIGPLLVRGQIGGVCKCYKSPLFPQATAAGEE
jgi:hypothetical protein